MGGLQFNYTAYSLTKAGPKRLPIKMNKHSNPTSHSFWGTLLTQWACNGVLIMSGTWYELSILSLGALLISRHLDLYCQECSTSKLISIYQCIFECKIQAKFKMQSYFTKRYSCKKFEPPWSSQLIFHVSFLVHQHIKWLMWFPVWISQHLNKHFYFQISSSHKTTHICRIKGCGGAGFFPPHQYFSKDLSYPNKLYIVGKRVYRRVRIIKNIGKIFWFRDFMSNFREIGEI